MTIMRKTTIVAAVLWVGMAVSAPPARALDKCKAHIRLSDGTILVYAKDVSGTLLWGMSTATVTNAFANAATCITGSPLHATQCTLGTGSIATTPPPLCTLYLKDGVGTCSTFIRKCIPSTLARFIDNGDGTVTDTRTGLMWEKKTTDGSVHDVTKGFTWSTGDNNFDGTAETDFLDVLNDVANGGAHCFAGYCDWRLPDEEGDNAPGGPKELETILDLTQGYCGGAAFGVPCVVPGLGLTAAGGYWSSTMDQSSPGLAWLVDFEYGTTAGYFEVQGRFVRAVRSGL